MNDVYHISSEVLYPPVDIDTFKTIVRNPYPPEQYYLCHGRISFHKRLDLAILACLKLNRKLIISGKSALDTDIEALKALIPDDQKDLIVFLGRTTDLELQDLVANAKAFLFPGKEDAGIAPIEMIAAGLPIIAYKSGGALEYVSETTNGVFFDTQDVNSMAEAIIEFEQKEFKIETIKNSVNNFQKKYFWIPFKKLFQKI